jgi:hypothetical protein
MTNQTAFKLLNEQLRPSPLDPYSYMKDAPQLKPSKSVLTLDDIITLYVCGETVLNTMPELKGEPRRRLRLAVNRAKRTVSNL